MGVVLRVAIVHVSKVAMGVVLRVAIVHVSKVAMGVVLRATHVIIWYEDHLRLLHNLLSC